MKPEPGHKRGLSLQKRVRSVALILPNKDKMIPTNYQGGPLPSTLEPGHSLDIYEDFTPVETTLRNGGYRGTIHVRAAFGDGTGKVFESVPMAISL